MTDDGYMMNGYNGNLYIEFMNDWLLTTRLYDMVIYMTYINVLFDIFACEKIPRMSRI